MNVQTDQDRQACLKIHKKNINKQSWNLPIKISSRKLKAASDLKKHTKPKVVILDMLKPDCRPHTEINTCSWQSEADRREKLAVKHNEHKTEKPQTKISADLLKRIIIFCTEL